MALCIKEKIFSSTKKYEISNENGELRYTTEGRNKGQFFVAGNQIHIFDRDQHEVAFVHQVFHSIRPTYELYLHGELKGTIKPKVSFFKPHYQVDFLSYRIDGKPLGWHFDIYQKDILIAQLEPRMITIGSVYYLSCPNPADELSALVLAIAIDLIGNQANIGWDFM